MYRVALALAVFIVLPFLVNALGNESLTLTKQIGGYTIEIDYPNPFVASSPEFLNLLLLSGATQVPYTTALFTVSDSASQVIFNANLARVPGRATNVTLVFPTAGQYTIQTIFMDASTTVAGTSFPVSVSAASVKSTGTPTIEWVSIGVIIGVIAGLILAPFFRRYERFLATD